MSLRLVRPGLLTTVQDLGRFGHQHEGVPVGGAMDAPALRLANSLVGNPESAACLEVTLLGPALQLQDDVVLAITGADLSATLDDKPIALGRALLARAGTHLTFGQRNNGCRAYVAFAGGIDVPIVLGSRSTYLRARMGGFNGRALAKDDVVPLGRPSKDTQRIAAALPAGAVAAIGPGLPIAPRDAVAVRAMRGRHFAALTAQSRAALLSANAQWFRLSPQSDRMGYRLDGPQLALRHPLEIISEPVVFGTVQLPPGGNPIVLMADRQTTGGYPRVLEVATVDLPLLAQTAPGMRIRFTEVSLEEAQRLYIASR